MTAQTDHFMAPTESSLRIVGHEVEPVRRVRGLRMPALPSWPLLAQVSGAVAALTGVWQEWGSPAALIAGGVAAVVVGALREAGKV